MKKAIFEYRCAAVNLAQWPPADLPEFAVIGRSNVGKSSLINTLAGGRKIARTSKTPGKTRLLHFYDVSKTYRIVDLPGYGFARATPTERQKWEKMATEYLSQRENLKAVILLVDSRHGPTPLDTQMASWLFNYHINFFVVATKADKLKKSQREKIAHLVKNAFTHLGDKKECFFFSSLSKMGKEELLRFLYTKALESVE